MPGTVTAAAMGASATPGGLPLKVVFYLREDLDRKPGGDLVEALALRDGLRGMGHKAELVRAGERVPFEPDVVHLFNLVRAPELASFMVRNGWFPSARVVLTPVLSPRGGSGLGRVVHPRLSLLARGAWHGVLSGCTPRWVAGGSLSALCRRVDGVIAHTEAERIDLAQQFPDLPSRVTVVPPPVVLPQTDPSLEPSLEPLRPYVAAVGRIEPLKNQIWLLRSGLDRLTRVVLAGWPSPTRPVWSLMFRLHLRRHPSCHYLEGLDRSEVRAVLESAEAHILASRRENFGLVTVEALSVGCEAVVPAHHWLASELGECLHTFTPGDSRSLREAVSNILGGDRRAGRFDLNRFDPAAVCAELARFYESLLVSDG